MAAPQFFVPPRVTPSNKPKRRFTLEQANRTLPLGIQRFMGDQLEDTGMIATGLMIAIVPVIIVYAFFSEKLIQGMTAGAVK